LNRYATKMSTALAASLAVAALAIHPSPADASPSCAEGPQTVGEAIYGTPCADTIHVPRGVTVVNGEGGDDTLYGGRGNQSLYGGPGNDRLYGGIGDDHLRGGPGNDLLSGGFGADSLDGEEGSDFARGDATIDYLGDSGAPGTDTDTLSFATGVTPGFPNAGNLGYSGFPESAEGRGVFLRLGENFANDGTATNGGGLDRPLPDDEPLTEEETFESFEMVVGTPFSDLIEGTPGDQTIYGGGGADVILGGGGEDHIFGGDEGDYCDAGAGFASECEFDGGERKVEPRAPEGVSAGRMAPQSGEPAALYLTGSDEDDTLVASYSDPPGPTVQVGLAAGGGPVDSLTLDEPPDSVVLAGLGGDDSLQASGFPATTSIVLLGGDGEDQISGGETEDALVDGPGDDEVVAAGGDDALPNNQGEDDLSAGAGNDLFISDAVCEGDSLNGGGGVDNANWANFESPVSIDLATASAGLVGSGGMPDCGGGSETSLSNLEDIEATNLGDTLIGDAGENQLLGRRGPDSYYAGPGDDTILANSGTPEPDPDPVIDCGEGFDTAEIDYPENGPDAVPVDCEAVFERAPNSFRPPQTPPGPEPEAEPSPPAPAPPPPSPVDETPPRTRLLHRPAKLVHTRGHRRRVAFVFSSSELGSSFRCRLDRGPFRPCRSPRRYRVGPGHHAFRVFAVDAAGNADGSPVVFRFRVARLSDRSSQSHRHRARTR
jgi:Ca2+-binding RTX toxin-like protein